MSGTTKADKTEKVGITLPITLVKQTDKARGDIPRSTFIRRASRAIHERKERQQMNFGDYAPFLGTIGGGFFVDLITAYTLKKVIKLAAVVVGLFIAALAYLEYQRILNVDWDRIQVVSQNGITWVVDAITLVLLPA